MTRTLEILDRLIAYPTVSRTSNLALVDWAEDLLVNAGWDVTRIPSPDGTKAGLHARIGPKAAGGICLSAHTDVVPADGQPWTRDPFKLTREGDRLFGRGTTDMKGFLASALALAERAGGTALSRPLSLVLSYDEEIGCVGIQEMIPALHPLMMAPDLVIVGEPTSMGAATGHKGKAALRVTCKGEAGHSAMAPNFLNAIHVAADFVAELRNVQHDLAGGPLDTAYDIPYSTVHVGRIDGGRALNIVPDSTTLEVEVRYLAETTADAMIQLVTQAAHRTEARFERSNLIEITQTGGYPGLEQPVDAGLTSLIGDLTGSPETTKIAFGTEGGVFAALGLKTLVIGPGNMSTDGHQPDESLPLSELRACDAMMDRVLSKLT